MKKTDKKNKDQSNKENPIVNREKIKFLGITKELPTDIESVDPESITGGKQTDPTVRTQWPTINP
ncbi:hypothetical protein [Chryseobacterium sp.]|uniref:hypothetical protein n=1 Tax=Chryseobacterium sp. TaxID=1871047 RepID=UPI0025BAD723|nr:hypothetical protein [Chryseobacterium sp.]MBV8327459.1 hypothetical protein [Chryseobacterium sp.]